MDTNVWKWFLGGLTVLGLGLLVTSELSAAPLKDIPKMQEQMFTPSVQLGNFCSGTVIYSDRDDYTSKVSTVVLTARHCTDGASKRIPVVVRNYGKTNREVSSTSYLGKVLGSSYKSDLALIKLIDENTIFTTAKIAPKETGESLVFGQDVFSVSYPLGGSQTFTTGALGRVEYVDAFGALSESSEFYRSTPDILGGSSGSALFQNATGDYEIIGVLTGGYTRATFMNLYTPIEEIHEYLDVAKKVYEVKKIGTKE